MTFPPRRAHRADERGAAMVEFAFVGLLFVLLVTGLISFGLILSFKQNLTQAAAEGARAGATAPSGDDVARAQTATDNAVAAYSQSCTGGGALACDFVEEDCGADPEDGTITQTPGTDDCITVILTYDYDADPLLPKFPILSAVYPDTISSASTAEVNP